MHSFRGAEYILQTLLSNTFCSSTRIKYGKSRKYNDTALSRRHPSLYGNSILLLAPQNTLTKTSFRHFFITYEAVTDTFTLDTNHRTTPPPFSRPHTSSNSRYSTICIFKYGVVIRVTHKTLDVFENTLLVTCLNDFYIHHFMSVS
jgi:hypothetical protein